MKRPTRLQVHDSQIRLADWIARISGSMGFVWGFTIISVFWLAVLESAPFGVFTMVISMLAIYLATFILISQNRQSELDRQTLRNQGTIMQEQLAMSEVLRGHLKNQDNELDIIRDNIAEHRKHTQEDSKRADEDRDQILKHIEGVREEARRVQRELKAFKKSHDEN